MLEISPMNDAPQINEKSWSSLVCVITTSDDAFEFSQKHKPAHSASLLNE